MPSYRFTSRSLTLGLLVAGLVPLAPAMAQSTTSATPVAGPATGYVQAPFDPNVMPKVDDVLAAMKHEAASEVARMSAIDADPASARDHGGAVSANWVAATFFIGAEHMRRVTSTPDVEQYTLRTARKFNYALQGGGSPVNLINADDQTLGDVYEDIYLRAGQPGILMPLQQRLDYTIPYLTKTPQPKRLVWWWCDALFMAPTVYARMSDITGDPKYIKAMDVQWWRIYDRLWDSKEHLFARDERFVTRLSPNGKKIFWSRGEGWVVAGLARLLEAMPENFPTRPKYVKVYQEMVAKLITLQGSDGLWRSSLEDTEAFPEAETSGTALDTFAIAFGINHGLLDRKTYLPHVLAGWAGLNHYILPSGILGQVQTGGDQPVPTRLETTGLYASGAYLLAGSEIVKLNDPTTPLPLPHMSAPAKMVPMGVDFPVSRPATTPAEETENKRRDLEHQAVKDLAYDPLTDDPDYRSVYAVAGQAQAQPLPQGRKHKKGSQK